MVKTERQSKQPQGKPALKLAAPADSPASRRRAAPSDTAPGLADVQLLNVKQCCAPGQVGATWWRSRVAAGEAPQPVVQTPRCTRWRASEVREFWERFAATGGRLTKDVA